MFTSVTVLGRTVFNEFVLVLGDEEVHVVTEIFERAVFDAVVPADQELDTLVGHLTVVDGRCGETEKCVHLS